MILQEQLDQTQSAAVQQVQGPPAVADASGLPTDLNGLRALIRTMLGQSSIPTGTWRMSAYQSATRLDAIEPRLLTAEQVSATQQQLITQLLAGAAATSEKVVALTARIELLQAAGLTTQAQIDLNTANDALAVARVVALEQQEAADHLADAAALLYQQQNDARVALLEARATKDEQAIAAAQTKLDATATSAAQAITAAAAAQSTANTAKDNAATAQTTATDAKTAAATNAQTLATVQADVATRLPAALVQRFTVATPQVTLTVAPGTFNVPLPKAFSDNQYLVFFTPAPGSALLNVRLSDQNKQPASFTATMQQTGLTSLLVPASSAEVLVFHL